MPLTRIKIGTPLNRRTLLSSVLSFVKRQNVLALPSERGITRRVQNRMHKIDASTPLGRTVSVRYLFVPDTCPVCQHASEVKKIGTAVLFPEHVDDRQFLQIVFRCPRQQCGSLFIAEYFAAYDHRSQLYFSPNAFYPRSLIKGELGEGVSDISPKFVELLNQSLAAETHNLGQIAGMGFRKALEFLVKDYCIHKVSEEADEIRSCPLSQCIKKYVSDQNIQNCAKRAAWLGNDETHYTRIWTDHDIKDLKVLIKLTQNWISNELLTHKYLSEMPERPDAAK